MDDVGMIDDHYPSGAEAWAAFAATRAHIHVESGTITVQPGAVPERFPWHHPLHVITGWNPGVVRSQEQNQVANAELAEVLRSTGRAVYPAEGCAIDGSWSEESFAVEGLSPDEAIEIGRRFGQLAIFGVSAAAVAVIGCALT